MLRVTRHSRSVPFLVRGAARKAAPKPKVVSEPATPTHPAEPTTSRTTTAEKKEAGWTPSERWAVPPNEVRKRSMWESWAALPANQRLTISLGICAFAVAGMYATDLLEENLPAPRDESQPGRKAGLGD